MAFPVAELDRYLSTKLGEDITVADLQRFGRGTSRQTWFVTLRDPAGSERKLALRCDHPSGATDPSPLDREYFLYERLGRTAVPVAKALWWEDDPRWTTRPFYVREHVEGSWDVPGFNDPSPNYDALRIAISKEHLSKLAILHQVDWKALGFDTILPAPASVEDCAANYVDYVLEQFAEPGIEPVPLALEAAEWLKARAPVAPRISLCKGTNGLGEEILRDGKIVALSDWEEASIGDPAADFAFMQQFVPEIERDGVKLWGLEQALDYYHEISGIRITPEVVGYYGVLRSLKMYCFCVRNGAQVTEFGKTAEARACWTAIEVGNIGQRILAAAMGWMPPPDPVIFVELNQSVDQS